MATNPKRRRLRTSERTTFAACPQKWWWGYQERWRPKVAGPALRFGSLVHKALELRYPPGVARGPHPAPTFSRLYEVELAEAGAMGFRDEDGNWTDAHEMGVAMLEAFVEEYGEDEEWEVVSSEQTFSVKVTPKFNYVGTFDGLWRHRRTGMLVIKEWKTTDQFWFKHLPLDEQTGAYWTFAPAWLRAKGILHPEDNLKGIMFTFLRKNKPDTRPRNAAGQALNANGSVSKRQPPPMFHRETVFRDRFDRQMIRARAIAQFNAMEAIRNGQASLWKSPSRFHCMGCPFLDPCELHETGADYALLLRAGFEKHDPYSQYAIQEEGK